MTEETSDNTEKWKKCAGILQRLLEILSIQWSQNIQSDSVGGARGLIITNHAIFYRSKRNFVSIVAGVEEDTKIRFPPPGDTDRCYAPCSRYGAAGMTAATAAFAEVARTGQADTRSVLQITQSRQILFHFQIFAWLVTVNSGFP
jgi:hypothetical protein